jgi:CRISPR-associated protein Cas2
MIQFSVYSKIVNNRDAAVNQLKIIQSNVPQRGQIRMMLVTEKQYSRSIIIIGGKTNQDKVLTIDPFVLL